MSKSGRFRASVIGSRLRFFRNPRDFPSLLPKEGMREATASRDADLAVGVVALSSASHAVS